MPQPWCIQRYKRPRPKMYAELFKTREAVLDGLPPGVLGIPSHHLGRYREFEECFTSLFLPAGSVTAWGKGEGGQTAHNMNNFIREMLHTDTFQWLWVIGDDHVFSPDIIVQLLKRNKDVVVPLCVRRNFPYIPVVHEDGRDGDWASMPYEWFKGKKGLVELKDKLTGNAGMLVRRNVFEAIPDPWYEMGQIRSEDGAPDLWFAKKVLNAGFSIYLDMDNPIGHISHTAVWPFLDEETEEWKWEIRQAGDVFGHRGLSDG